MNLLHLLLALAGRTGAWSKSAVVTPSLGLPATNGGSTAASFSREGARLAFPYSDGSGANPERVFVVNLNGPGASVEVELSDGSTDGSYGTGGVALSADGNTAVVGDASYASDDMNARGRAFVYSRAGAGNWPLVQTLDGPQAFSYLSGGGLALSSDAGLLAAASLYSTGGSHQAVHIYSGAPGSYSLAQSIPTKGKLCASEDLGVFMMRGVNDACQVYRRGSGLTWSLAQEFPGEYPSAVSPDGEWIATITTTYPFAYRFYRWSGATFLFSSTLAASYPSGSQGPGANGFPPYNTLTRYGEFFHAYESTDATGKVYRRSGDSWATDVVAVPGLVATAPTGRSRLSPWGNYLVWPNGPFVYAYR